MVRQGDRRLGLFSLLVATFAVQAILSGLNWNVGWHPARFMQPVVAAVLPAFSFAAFDQLRRNRLTKLAEVLPHMIPAICVAFLVAFWRAPIDIVLFAVYLGYGLSLLRIARQGPEALSAVRITDEWTAYKALVAIAVMLVATAFMDAIVSLDFFLGEGEQARTILAIASVLWLVVAGYAATVADDTHPDNETNIIAVVTAHTSSPPTPTSIEDDEAIARRIDALMLEQHLYRDPDLTLERLARRAGIPGRQISGALNRVHGRNISQVVNEYRITEARRRLVSTSDPVTAIMLESGFGTKSNFNREFLRVTGMSPSHYRRSVHETSVAPDERPEASAL